MTSTPLVVLLTVAAVWPFGRDRDDDGERDRRHREPEPTGTIRDLERADVSVDTNAKIAGSETKAMESYRLFLDLSSDDPLLRAEAMRRLADLQLETAEAEKLQANLQEIGEGLGGTID